MTWNARDDSTDLAYMAHSVAEKHQVHGSVVFVVLVEGHPQKMGQCVVALDLIVGTATFHFGDAFGEWRAHQGLGILVLEVLREVEPVEHFLGQLCRQTAVLFQVRDRHQTVAVHALAFVDPEQDKLLRVVELGGLGRQQTCKDAAHVPDVELVVEVGSCLPEGGNDHAVQAERSLDDTGDLLHDARLEGEALEVALHEGGVDGLQCRLLWERHGASPEVALQARVHNVGTGRRVHARDVLRVADVLHRDLASVPPVAVVLLLLQKLDGTLRVVLVKGWHVQVINEVDELQFSWRSVQLSGFLLQRILHHGLDERGVRVVGHVHGIEHEGVCGEHPQQTQARLRLATARQPDEHDGVVLVDQSTHQVGHRNRLARRHCNFAHGCLGGERDLFDGGRPLLELRVLDEVVENLALGRILDGFHLTFPPVAEILAVIHAIHLGKTESDRGSEAEEEPVLQHLVLIRREQVLQETAACHEHVDVHHRHQDLRVLHNPQQRRAGVLLEHFRETLLDLRRVFLPVDPTRDVGLPLDTLRVAHAHDARARGRGGRGIVQISDLEDHFHVDLQRDALVGGQCEQAVVVHDAVHGLDPVGVQVAVEHDPLRVHVRDLPQVPHDLRDDPVLPLSGLHVHEAVQLIRRDGLGAKVDHRRFLSSSGLRVLQDLPKRGLEAARVAHQEDAVPDAQQLDELRDLKQQVAIRVVCVAVVFLHDFDQDLLDLVVARTRHIDAREEVGQQAHEDL
mmetsp:Transcript_146757/g.471071  ORF Transcript_146757/g.471071 Transcript_146757/m.471071 type:complete len:738 (-) Transcript_146757:5257-7470(-)